MKKQSTDKQRKINILFSVAIIGLVVYSAILTSVIIVHQSSNESVDESLAESIFKIQVDEAKKESGL